MKSGIVALVGRPNVGKSTLLNTLLGQKVSITSPKPQTTRFPIQAVYEDERGQIIFVDTPGIFTKVKDQVAARINMRTEETIEKGIDVIVYMVDHTRERAEEESRVLGMVRKLQIPKILVVNKVDVKTPTHIVQYRFMEDEFDEVVEISALENKHIPILLEKIFERLPEGSAIVDTAEMVQPGLNLDSKTFISEIIREKAFLNLRREVPYAIAAVVDDIEERDNGVTYIKARLLTSADRYKGMIIGANGEMIKEISMAARKELEVASNKKVYLELTVETDEHWIDFV
ncbi:GTPase Era [Candidatus Gottesmanbacteria bacterium]|nr:GTPase Era [Candidatus Gottesmanbacteria bacterium]